MFMFTTHCKHTIFFSLLAKRLTTFLTVNNYIDDKVQKAFLPGINGFNEHNVLLDKIISQAKTNKKTVQLSAAPSHNTYPQKV